MNEPEHDPVQNAQRWAFIIGVIALIACAIGWVTEPAQFFLSYLAAFLIWLGVALGSLSWAMIHYLTGGRWGYAVRRFFEAAMSTLPLLLLLFVPVFFGLSYLYPWTHAAERVSDEVLRHRQAYMNMPGFVDRAGSSVDKMVRRAGCDSQPRTDEKAKEAQRPWSGRIPDQRYVRIR